jgi:hypothetical protein
MKKILYLFLLFSASINAQADDVYDVIAKETCSCIESKKIDINAEAKDNKLTMTLGLCMIESHTKHKMELPEKDRTEFGNDKGMQNLGEKVAIKMVSHCPDYIIALGQMEDEESTTEVKQLTIEGKVTGIETKQFVSIKLKDKNNRSHNLLLLNYFETASLYTEGTIKSGIELIVGYDEVEMYDPEAKDFKYFKIITSLQKK